MCTPLRICRRTGTVGGMNLALFMKNFKVAKSNVISKLMLTSAAPGVGTPGAPGFSRGCRFVSRSGLELGVWEVVGSALGARR